MYLFTIQLMGLVGPAISLTAGRDFASSNSSFFEGFPERALVADGSNMSYHGTSACCCYKSCFSFTDDTECILETGQCKKHHNGKDLVDKGDLHGKQKNKLEACLTEKTEKTEKEDKAREAREASKAVRTAQEIAQNKEKTVKNATEAFKQIQQQHLDDEGKKDLQYAKDSLEHKKKAWKAYEDARQVIDLSNKSNVMESKPAWDEAYGIASQYKEDLSKDNQARLKQMQEAFQAGEAAATVKASKKYKDSLKGNFDNDDAAGLRVKFREIVNDVAPGQRSNVTKNEVAQIILNEVQEILMQIERALAPKAVNQVKNDKDPDLPLDPLDLINVFCKYNALSAEEAKKIITDIFGESITEKDLNKVMEFLNNKNEVLLQKRMLGEIDMVRSKTLLTHIMKKFLRKVLHSGFAKS